ncbi:hypothetical protein AX769_13215 [Frondihabitans sp. PAMC 28766]|uniref:hypothetical protein n=1 Tax=Frondihabitans sp. PAMC 28766 TaxID=1795630 RepID=UPI00078E63F7|nr:hypothetical protein [Frondihabitans sp. PAMC 28766]AMM20925.1 hypothetical protein AX769_13215 [Frondihabitans sp. PAMC 28766]
MFTITLPPLLQSPSEGRVLAEALPDEGAAHVEIDASLNALADHGFVDELLDELLARGLEVLVVDGAHPDLRGTFASAASARDFGEIWFATDSAA